MSFGSKKSTSTQSTTAYNTDSRFVADAGSVGISGSGNTVNMTDGGLIEDAFAYLSQADAMVTERNNATLTIAGNTAQAVIDAGMKAGADAVSAATNALSTMGRVQQGDAGRFDNSTIIAALIGAVALIATTGGRK